MSRRPASHPLAPAGTTRFAGRQRGVALVFVLWAGLLVSALALAVSVTVRSTTVVAGAAAERVRVDALAAAGVRAGIVELLTPTTLDAGYFERRLSFPLGGGEVDVVMLPEHGRIDLNRADPALLKRLADIVTGGDGEALSEALLARRTPASADEAGTPGVFLSPRELLDLPGVDRVVYARLRAATTVDSAQAGIDPLSAPRDVLLALPGATQDIVDRYLAERGEHRPDDPVNRAVEVLRRAREMFPAAVGQLVARRPSVYSVVSLGRLPGGARAKVQAIVAVRATDPRGYSILAWHTLGLEPPQGPPIADVDPG